MSTIWQLQDAKNRLSEVIDKALNQGPQLMIRRGQKAVVVLAYAEYEKMRKYQGKLSKFFRASPLAEIELERDTSMPRPGIEL